MYLIIGYQSLIYEITHSIYNDRSAHDDRRRCGSAVGSGHGIESGLHCFAIGERISSDARLVHACIESERSGKHRINPAYSYDPVRR